MKKWIGFLVLAVCLFLNSALAKADVIWTPDDSFFMEYEDDCIYTHRSFLVNAPGGAVIVQESPTDATEAGRIKNGTKIWIEWIYEDSEGNVWGAYDGWFDGNESGWLPLEHVDLIYDYISFEEDHGTEFVKKEGAAELPEGGDKVYVWDYPGSPVCTLMYEWAPTPEEMPTYSVTYEDEDGRTWGFCGYHYGWRNFWICLDDVTADHEKLYGSEPVEPVPEIDNLESLEKEPDRSNLILGCAVGGVVVITAIVLVVMKKKMKKGM